MRKTKNIIRLIIVILVIGIPSLHVKADYDYWDYYSNQDGFDEVDKEHEWIVNPNFPEKIISTPEVSYMYNSETDSYTDELTYSEHSYCAKCGFDISKAILEGKDGFAEHEKTGCTYMGRITGYYYINVKYPARYVCKNCGASKSFVTDDSQEGLLNQYNIQNGDYDKIVWYITGKCTPPSPSPSPSPTPTPSSSPTTNPTIAPTSSPTVAPTSTPTASVDAPSAPTLKSVKNLKGKKLNVKWKKVKGAKGYQVQYALNKSFTKSKRSDNTVKCTYAKKNLKKKKTYYVRVRAYVKDSNNKKLYGDWSKVKKVKIQK